MLALFCPLYFILTEFGRNEGPCMLRVMIFISATIFGLMVWVSGYGPSGTLISSSHAETVQAAQQIPPIPVVIVEASTPDQAEHQFPFVIAKMRPVAPVKPEVHTQVLLTSYTTTPLAVPSTAPLMEQSTVVPAYMPAKQRVFDRRLWVTGPYVNMRLSPSSNAAIIGTLPRGAETIQLEGGQHGWLHIQDKRTGLTGFMYQSYLAQRPPENG